MNNITNPNIDTSSYASVPLMYSEDEDTILKNIIIEYLDKDEYKGKKYIKSVEKRNNIITLILSLILFVNTFSMFFRIISFGLNFLIFLILITIYLFTVIPYSNMKYVIKEIKNRPDDDIKLILSSIYSDSINYSLKYFRLPFILICSILPVIFIPGYKILYERADDGYHVRYYFANPLTYNNITDITIPDYYKNEKVTGIRGDVFKDLTNLKSVHLPDSINTIRGHAFAGDYNLTDINIPSSLTYLGGYSFVGCSSIKSVSIPSGITEINGHTFENCTSLESVDLPDNLKSIGAYAFSHTYIHDIKLPDGIEELHEGSFQDNDYLETINLPNSITKIGASSFSGCISLNNIILPDKITEIHGSTFKACTSLESIIIPDGVTRIGGSAFRECSNLRSALIPKSVLEIGSSAFRDTALKEVTINRNCDVDEKAFKNTYLSIYYYDD